MRALVRIIAKEIIQLKRDPKIVPILFVAPVMQLFLLGYAATTDIRHVELAVVDLDRTAASRTLRERFVSSGYFRLVAAPDSQMALPGLLDTGRARVALTIPAGYGDRRAAGRPAEVQILADGSDAMVGTVGLGYAMGVIDGVNREAGIRPAVPLRPRVLYNPDLLSRFFMVPGVMAMVIMVMTIMLSAVALVREKETGTMEQLLVTPLSQSQIMAGKLVPFFLVGLVEIATVLPVMLLLFRVPLRGSAVVLILFSLPFMLCTLGLGLLVSTLAETQQQAMMLSAFVVILPQIYLSGFIFPLQNMPVLFQWLSYVVPLRYYVTVLRGVFLKGVGPAVLWPQVLAMVLLGTAILAVARARFRRKVG